MISYGVNGEMPVQRSDLFQEIVRDAVALVKETAKAGRGKLTVSPEVAALLESVQPRPSVPEMAAPAPVIPALSTSEPLASGTQEELPGIDSEVKACRKCGLCETRRNTVFGVGHPAAQLVFVGEAPGADEDRQGEPFVGRAGQLLTDIIVKGMQMRREDVYICNVLKCRPPENRDPNPEEVFHCEPYLLRQLDVIKPKVICALGRVAAQTLLRTSESTTRLRGRWHNYHGIPLRVTYHPAYLLRTPSDKGKCWEDVKEILKVLRGEVTPDMSGGLTAQRLV